MPEYRDVEKPFLDQLRALGWEVIDQDTGMPEDPAASDRAGFREVLLQGRFKRAVRALNRTDDGRAWPAGAQRNEVFDDLARPEGSCVAEPCDGTGAGAVSSQPRNEGAAHG